MILFLFVAFLVVPLLELYLFVKVGNSFGFGTTIVWIVAVSVIGAWLVKREGLGALRRAQERLGERKTPTDELLNGLLILIAGALLLTPGFLTDAFGMTLLFPPTRTLYRTALKGRFLTGPMIVGQMGQTIFGTTHRTDQGPSSTPPTDGVWDVDSWEDPPHRPELP